MTPPSAQEQDSSLAALIGAVADGNPVTPLAAGMLRLRLVKQAKDRGLSWTVIGALYGVTGKEMKRDVRALDRRVQRELMAAKGKTGRSVAVPHVDFSEPTGNPQAEIPKGYGLTSLRTRRG